MNITATHNRFNFWGTLAGAAVGLAAGALGAAQPLYLFAALLGAAVLFLFFAQFERTVLGLLVLRSALDVFSAQQLPTILALGVDVLTVCYLAWQVLFRRPIRSDGFWWFLAGWVAIQGLWPLLSILGGLGFASWTLPVQLREWTRLFSYVMVYLLVMQMKGRIAPDRLIRVLLLSLVIPVAAAYLQVFLPESLLPAPLHLSQESRIFGTFGHANTFAAYLLLFIGLVWWQWNRDRRRWGWLVVLAALGFAYASTHALVSIVMLVVWIVVMAIPRLNPVTFISALLALSLVVGLFASTEFGRQRLNSLAGTPLFNPKIDVSRAILMQAYDNNSFNWRIYHWTSLLKRWEKSQLLGYGLATGIYLAPPDSLFIPHNDYVRSLVEGGFVGLGTFIALLVAQAVRIVQLIVRAPRRSAQKELAVLLLAVFIATSIAMCTDNVWICTAFYFYWWTLLAIASWDWPSVDTTPHSPVTIEAQP